MGRVAGSARRSAEDTGGGGHPGADAGVEVAPDPFLHHVGAPVALEAVEIEPEALGPLPEVGVVHPPPVGIERVDHLEEAPLPPCRLGGCVQGRRAWVLAGKREVAEREASVALADMPPFG